MRVVLWHHQQIARLGADLFNGRHRRLHCQRQHLRSQVVPAGGKQVGVHRREFEARIAYIDRGVKGRRVLHPLQAKPAFDGWHRVQNALLQLVDRAVQSGDEMGNHAATFRSVIVFSAKPLAGTVHRWWHLPGLQYQPVVHPRTSPSPSTTYFSDVSPSMPTGPRAWNLSVLMPISAPRPNSKPSAKRVLVLTMTLAESTSRKKR